MASPNFQMVVFDYRINTCSLACSTHFFVAFLPRPRLTDNGCKIASGEMLNSSLVINFTSRENTAFFGLVQNSFLTQSSNYLISRNPCNTTGSTGYTVTVSTNFCAARNIGSSFIGISTNYQRYLKLWATYDKSVSIILLTITS